MQLLAIESSTDTLSVAVCRGTATVFAHEGPGGAQASAQLIPTVLSLLARAQLRLADLDAVVFGAGPGAFTGLRTACAVAQGLAWGAQRPVLGLETLMAVADDARLRCGAPAHLRVTALLDARMDEVYAGTYCYADGVWQREGAIGLLAPEALAHWPRTAPEVWAGNVGAAYGARLGALAGQVHPARPHARTLLRLAPPLIEAGHASAPGQALPLYVRDRVALTSAERAAATPAKASAPMAQT